MPDALKVRKIGNSLTPYDPEFAESMEDAREFMRTHRNAFRELA